MLARRPVGLSVLAVLLAAVAALLVVKGGAAAEERDGAQGPSAASGIECLTTQSDGTWCEKGSLLGGNGLLAISPDGRNAYEIPYPPENESRSILYVYDRDPSTGSLVQKSGTAGCIASRPRKGCQTGRALLFGGEVAVSPDGRNVYVSTGGTLAIFDRDPATGELGQKAGVEGCIKVYPKAEAKTCSRISGLGGVSDMTFSPDGRDVYVASARALVRLDRDPSTGALTLAPGPDARIRGAEGGIAISPDGANLYAFGGPYPNAQLKTFVRNPETGGLTRAPGPAGCVSGKRNGRCRYARMLMDGFLVVSPDGRNVYNVNGGEDIKDTGNLLTFDRLPDGTLVQKQGRAGCLSEGGLIMDYKGCAKTFGIYQPRSLGITPDGKTIFVSVEYPFEEPTFFTRDPSGRLTPTGR
jgi:hypothetical protein